MKNPFRYFKTSPDVIRLAVMMYVRYLWRAVDHEGDVLEEFVTKRRDRRAALNFLLKAMARFRSPAPFSLTMPFALLSVRD
jgi:transposase-like protein